MMPKIRMAVAADAEDILTIYAPIVEKTAVSFESDPPSPAEVRKRISETTAVLPWLVYEKDKMILGYAYAVQHRSRGAYQWSVETSVYIHPDGRRRGIGRALYTSLFRILKAQGIFNVFAGITLPNPGSIALHQSLGFQPIGTYSHIGFKHGNWHDVSWWQLLLGKLPSPPQTPSQPIPISGIENLTDLLTIGLAE